MTQPSDIVNRAIDVLGLPERIIGDIETDGTEASEAARRVYYEALRQLLSAAHWAFARQRGQLQLLADRLGQTINQATGQPYSIAVEPPWRFAYAWPIDGVRARWLPWNGLLSGGTVAGNIAIPPVPLMTGLPQASLGWPREGPGRFLLSTSDQFPTIIGEAANLPSPAEGVGLTRRRIVLTDVPCAWLVYTGLLVDPDVWDALFSEAMVAVLASRLAMPLIPDKKLSLPTRDKQMAIAVNAVREARAASGNEAGFPQSTDQVPDWIRARRAGYAYGWPGGAAAIGGESGPGYFAMGYDTSIF